MQLKVWCSPWGRCEWKGRWGDDSATWLLHAKQAEELGIEAERSDDGKFWMAVTGCPSQAAHCHFLHKMTASSDSFFITVIWALSS